MSNDRWTPRYEHDDAELTPEPTKPAPRTASAASEPAEAAPEQKQPAGASSAPDWGGGTDGSHTAKDWREGRVDPAPWQQGMTAKELAASAPEEEPEEPEAAELEPIEEEPAPVPAVREDEAPTGPSSGLLYGLGMLAMVLIMAPTAIALIEMTVMSGPWWGAALGFLPLVGALLAAHVLLRILLSIRDGRR